MFASLTNTPLLIVGVNVNIPPLQVHDKALHSAGSIHRDIMVNSNQAWNLKSPTCSSFMNRIINI